MQSASCWLAEHRAHLGVHCSDHRLSHEEAGAHADVEQLVVDDGLWGEVTTHEQRIWVRIHWLQDLLMVAALQAERG